MALGGLSGETPQEVHPSLLHVCRVVAAMIHKMAWSSSLHGWMDGKRLKRSRMFFFVFLGCVCVCVCVVAAMNITKISKCLGGRKKRERRGEVPLS